MPKPQGQQEQQIRQLVTDILVGRADYDKLPKDSQIQVYNWMVYNIEDPEQRQNYNLPNPDEWEKQLARYTKRTEREAPAAPAGPEAPQPGKYDLASLARSFARGGVEGSTLGLVGGPGAKYGLFGSNQAGGWLDENPDTWQEKVARGAGEFASALVPIGVAGKLGLGLKLVKGARGLLAGGRALTPALELALREAGTGATYGALHSVAEASKRNNWNFALPSPKEAATDIATQALTFAPFGVAAGRALKAGTAESIAAAIRAGALKNVGGKEVLPDLVQVAQGARATGYPHYLDPAQGQKVLQELETATSIPRTGRILPIPRLPIGQKPLPPELANGRLGEIIQASRGTTQEQLQSALEALRAGPQPTSPAAAVQPVTRATALRHTARPMAPAPAPIAAPAAKIMEAAAAEKPEASNVDKARKIALAIAKVYNISEDEAKGLMKKLLAEKPEAKPVAAGEPRPISEVKAAPISPKDKAIAAATPVKPGEPFVKPVTGMEQGALLRLARELGIVNQPEWSRADLEQAVVGSKPEVPAATPAGLGLGTPGAYEPRKPMPSVPQRTAPEKTGVIGTIQTTSGKTYQVLRTPSEENKRYTILFQGQRRSIGPEKVAKYTPQGETAKPAAPAGPATQPGSTAPADFRVPETFKKLTKEEQAARDACQEVRRTYTGGAE